MNTKVFEAYKGFTGSIEISVDDDCLFGKILYIDDLVNYFAKTPKELEIEFKKAVDDYLAFCKSEGVSPNKPFSGSSNVPVPVLRMHKSA